VPRPHGSDVSEFYSRGRAIFADATSFAFFVAGFLAAGPFAWPALRASFEAGAYDRGLAVFIARLFGGGLAAGLFGYIVGTLAGRLWQAWHQWRRARRQPLVAPAERAPRAAPIAHEHAVGAPSEPRAPTPSRAASAMTCRVGPLSPSGYATFARRLAADADDRRYVESAAAEIVTLAAWDGLEIAGVARLLSDGRGALFIMDVAVDPHYVQTEVEKALIDFARLRVPRGGRLTRV